MAEPPKSKPRSLRTTVRISKLGPEERDLQTTKKIGEEGLRRTTVWISKLGPEERDLQTTKKIVEARTTPDRTTVRISKLGPEERDYRQRQKNERQGLLRTRRRSGSASLDRKKETYRQGKRSRSKDYSGPDDGPDQQAWMEERMPRVRLIEQILYEFQSSFQVRPQDINYSGHVGNDNLISLVGAARAHLFNSMGLSELDLGDGQTGVIMTDLVVNYKAEAFLFDELLIDTHVSEVGRSGFRMCHRVRKDKKLIALIETGFATYDYKVKRIAPIPASFLNSLASLQIE